jgi:hypothetical protein
MALERPNQPPTGKVKFLILQNEPKSPEPNCPECNTRRPKKISTEPNEPSINTTDHISNFDAILKDYKFAKSYGVRDTDSGTAPSASAGDNYNPSVIAGDKHNPSVIAGDKHYKDTHEQSSLHIRYDAPGRRAVARMQHDRS